MSSFGFISAKFLSHRMLSDIEILASITSSQLGSQNSDRARMEQEKLHSSLEQASGDRIPGRKKVNQESIDDIRTKKQVD